MQKVVFLFLFLCSFVFSQEIDKEATYIHISSNLEDVMISINGKELGKPPFVNYKVEPNIPLTIIATNEDPYHNKQLIQTINIPKNHVQNIEFEFYPLKTEVFLVGEDGELYINGKFLKMLHQGNRLIQIDASSNVRFAIYKDEKQTHFQKDLKGGEFTQITYEMQLIPKEIRLYTTNTKNYIWEDTKEAVTQNITWKNAEKYCKNLEVSYLQEWRLPTIEELDDLYENHKDDIYNGYGEPFYWSGETFDDEAKIWSYAKVKSFVDGEVKKSIQEFEKGKVRCVHDIAFKDKVLENKKPIQSEDEELKPGEYDPNLTKDLKRFLLK